MTLVTIIFFTGMYLIRLQTLADIKKVDEKYKKRVEEKSKKEKELEEVLEKGK